MTHFNESAEIPAAPVLAIEGLTKSFGPTQALKSVDFSLAAGELRALVGGNGSGKSTFIKILAGVERPDRVDALRLPTGSVYSSGLTPAVARSEGLRFVHQDLALIDELTVGENLALGDGFNQRGFRLINWRDVHSRARRALDRFNIEVSSQAMVGQLPALLKTQVAVARALGDVDSSRRGVLVFDEPTTSMTNRESAEFLDWLRTFADEGQAVLFVSHRLDEVLSLAQTVTVFRDGQHVATVGREGLDERALVTMMTGTSISSAQPAVFTATTDAPRLTVRRMCVGPLVDVDLDLHSGEVVGLAGLLGSGRTSLLRAIAGDLAPAVGEMRMDGEPHAPGGVADAMAAGVAYVPEDRAGEGIFPDLSVADNLMAGVRSQHARHGWVSARREQRAVKDLIKEFRIHCGSPRHELATLSGGNQQKVVIARWLHRKPKLLLLDEPSQGVDVLARADIDDSIRRFAADGMSVLVVTSDFNELARVCDRVVLLRRGRIVGEMARSELSEASITAQTYASVGV